MDALSWRELDVGSVALAGLISGYLMALTGLWQAGYRDSWRSTSLSTAAVTWSRTSERLAVRLDLAPRRGCSSGRSSSTSSG